MAIPVLVTFPFDILTTLPVPCGKGQCYDPLFEAGELSHSPAALWQTREVKLSALISWAIFTDVSRDNRE